MDGGALTQLQKQESRENQLKEELNGLKETANNFRKEIEVISSSTSYF